MSKADSVKQRSSLLTVLIAILVGLFGILLISTAANADWLVNRPSWQTPVRELGGILFASVTVALLWELIAKRAFLAELMDAAKIAEDIRTAQLLYITSDFAGGIQWEDYFRKAHHITILFSYGNPWRNFDYNVLEDLAARRNVRVELMLPNPRDEKILFELARRFNQTPEDVRKGVLETQDEFTTLFEKGSAHFSIWYLNIAPVFSYYIFDDIVILSLYKHRRERVSVPAFVFERGGTIYDFINHEHEAIKKSKELAEEVLTKFRGRHKPLTKVSGQRSHSPEA